MESSLSNLVNKFSEGFIKLNVNLGTMMKSVKRVELNIGIVTVFLNIKNLKMIQ